DSAPPGRGVRGSGGPVETGLETRGCLGRAGHVCERLGPPWPGSELVPLLAGGGPARGVPWAVRGRARRRRRDARSPGRFIWSRCNSKRRAKRSSIPDGFCQKIEIVGGDAAKVGSLGSLDLV